MKSKAKAVTPSCPCDSTLAYDDCCGRWHRLADQQPDGASAEGLMRSRYCAYVLGLEPYLLATWAPQTRPMNASIDNAGIKWLGLRVISSETGSDNQQATVEFIARSRVNGKGQRHHEINHFERIDGQWFYVRGEVPLVSSR